MQGTSIGYKLCEICEASEAVYKCRLCGREVCERHFNKEKGICTICEGSLCELCHQRPSITFCPICGRLVCYEDSVQLDEVRRVCKECYAKGLANSYSKGFKINLTYVGGA